MKQSNPWKSSGSSDEDKKDSSSRGKGSGSFGNPFDFGGGDSGEGPEINFEIPESWKRRGKKMLVLGVIILVAIIAFCYWWFHPPINIQSSDLWVFCAFFILLPAWLILKGWQNTYRQGTNKHPENPKKALKFKRLSWIPVAIVLVGIIGAVASSTFFFAESYASILVTTEEDFATDIPEADFNTLPVIDKDSAAILGNRAMGTMADYVSQFEISDIYSQINYHGRPVRVSPLNYADFFKWFTNMSTGIPAYVIVDMVTQDTQIVRLNNPIYYSDSDPFVNNIDRYVQLKYPTYMFDQKSFEIDEEGNPYWVIPVQKRTIGLFGGTTIARVILCNASTGECQDLAIEEVPEWVDRAYPTDLLIEQYNWSGLYANGWWNSWLGQEGVKQTTPGTDGQLGYNYIAKDDDVWVYTGVTSATNDNSIIGFVLINQRTAESHFYSVSGATEESAMNSAEGQVQNLRYSATFPLLINISGQPTYFMSLKDAAGLVKMYGMVDIQRYQNVATGNTVPECQKSYKALLAYNGFTDSTDSSGTAVATGVINTMVQAVVEGNSHFYLTLVDDPRIYDVPVSLIEVVAYKVGDVITLTYVDGSPTATVTAIGDMTVSAQTDAQSADTQAQTATSAADIVATGTTAGAVVSVESSGSSASTSAGAAGTDAVGSAGSAAAGSDAATSAASAAGTTGTADASGSVQ